MGLSTATHHRSTGSDHLFSHLHRTASFILAVGAWKREMHSSCRMKKLKMFAQTRTVLREPVLRWSAALSTHMVKMTVCVLCAWSMERTQFLSHVAMATRAC